MITFNSEETQLDYLLDKMAEEVQLDKTRYERMISSYDAVKEWIESDEKFFKPYKYDVYPHGSVRILTTVKPIDGDEFDLDIAIHLRSSTTHSPQHVYNELERRLSQHAVYKEKMNLKNRCIRLEYAGDYHMDILPGIQENTFDEDKLLVPDRELGFWVSSNPRGYAKWFLSKANLAKESLLMRALKAEKLPTDNFSTKKPLQRAVQLIKRYRDIYFKDDDRYKTSSIILTTIAGQFYIGEESIFETVDNIVRAIVLGINLPNGRFKVLNPINKDEDFTDKWDKEPKYYDEFKRFANHLYVTWQKLKEENGVIGEADIMKGLFGEDVFTNAQLSQAREIERIRKNRSLGVSRSTGSLTSVGLAGSVAVKSNTFYGE